MSDLIALNKQGFNKFANLIGLEFAEVGEGRAVCTLDVREDLFHPGGLVHGGAAFALADSSMAMALISTLDPGQASSTVELKISYLNPVREGTMRCESRVIKRGKRIAFLESEVTVDGRLVATATATFAIVTTSGSGGAS